MWWSSQHLSSFSSSKFQRKPSFPHFNVTNWVKISKILHRWICARKVNFVFDILPGFWVSSTGMVSIPTEDGMGGRLRNELLVLLQKHKKHQCTKETSHMPSTSSYSSLMIPCFWKVLTFSFEWIHFNCTLVNVIHCWMAHVLALDKLYATGNT